MKIFKDKLLVMGIKKILMIFENNFLLKLFNFLFFFSDLKFTLLNLIFYLINEQSNKYLYKCK